MKIFVAAAALLFAPMAAFAAETAPPPAVAPVTATAPAAATTATPTDADKIGPRWSACAAEVQKFCANIERGKGKIRACLEGHTSELSDGCKTRMAEHHEQKDKPN